jgi:hypothetical protein
LNDKLLNAPLGMKSVFLDLADTRWITFASSQPEVNIFHHPAWTQLLADSYGNHPYIIAVCDQDNQIVAGLPILEVKNGLFGKRLVSLPFTDHCWLLSSNPHASEYLYECLCDYFHERKNQEIELRCGPPIPAIARTNSFFVRHFINLCPDLEAVAKRFHQTHLKNLKVAQKKGVHIERGVSQEYLDTFYHLQVLTRQRKGIPVQPRKFFELLRANLLEKGLGFISLAYQGNECLAGAVFLHWQKTLTYKYSASNSKGRNLCPNNMILWSAIRWGCENDYIVFDMGRTELDNSGLRWFKKGWGAEEVPLQYFTLGSVDNHNRNNNYKKIAKSLIRFFPTWVCRLTGEVLYRYFG